MQVEALLLQLIRKDEARDSFFLQGIEDVLSLLQPLADGLGLLWGDLRLGVLGGCLGLSFWGCILISFATLLHQLAQTCVALSHSGLRRHIITLMALIMMTILSRHFALGSLETTPTPSPLPLLDAALFDSCSSLV